MENNRAVGGRLAATLAASAFAVVALLGAGYFVFVGWDKADYRWAEAGFSRAGIAVDGFDASSDTAFLRLRIDMQPGWKTYWRYAGESGFPPEVTVQENGVEIAGNPIFPPPQRIRFEGDTSIGYSQDVGILVPLRLWRLHSRGISSARARVELRYAVCQQICAPESASWSIDLPPLDSWKRAALSQQARDILASEASAALAGAPSITRPVALEDGDGRLLAWVEDKPLEPEQLASLRAALQEVLASAHLGSSRSGRDGARRGGGGESAPLVWLRFQVSGLNDVWEADVFANADRGRVPAGGIVEIVSRDGEAGSLQAKLAVRADSILRDEPLSVTLVSGAKQYSYALFPSMQSHRRGDWQAGKHHRWAPNLYALRYDSELPPEPPEPEPPLPPLPPL